MPIDKSWMAMKNRLLREYSNGVKEFVEVGKAHVNTEGQMRCLCMNYLNRRFQAPRAIEMHLILTFYGELFYDAPAKVFFQL